MSEMFLAEAAVAVVPDLTAFRAKLIADLRTATKGVVATVNVAASKATTAAAAATQAGGRSNQLVGAANSAAAQQARAVSEANRKLAASQRTVELAERRALASSSETGAARTRAAAAVRAAFLAEEAYAAALTTNNGAVRAATASAVGLARAREIDTKKTLENLAAKRALTAEEQRGAAAAAARSQFIARGFASQALAAAGLRGAVLSANAAFLAGTVAAVGFFKAVSSAANVESQLRVFGVTAGASASEMEAVADAARQLGSDITLPGVNAQDAAETFTELSKAGLSVQDSLNGARGVLQLATAAGISNAEATQLAASALNAFGLAGGKATHVADVLTNAANAAQGSITDIGLSLQQAAAVSRQVGVSLEDTVSLLTLLAQNGIRGSDAGTSLRVAFTKLINPTQRAQEVLSSLNIQLRDTEGNIRPEVFSEFAEAQRGLTRAQQDANAGIVFGTDALRAYSIIAREGIPGLSKTREEIAKQGSAAELAAARMSGLSGAAENLKNQLSTLGLSIGNSLKGPLTDFVDVLAGGIQNINSFIDWLSRSDDQARVTGEAYDNLRQQAEELRDTQGQAAESEFLAHLEEDATQASLAFTNLIIEAGKMNRALQAREGVKQLEGNIEVIEHAGRAGDGLREEVAKLNAELEATQPAALKARDGIEAYRSSLTQAARDTQGFINAITPKEGFLPSKPVFTPAPVSGAATLEGQIALAQAQDNLPEVARLQKIALANARKAFRESTGDQKERDKLFKAVNDAEVALINTQRQISSQTQQAREKAQREALQAANEADRAAVEGIRGRISSRFDSRAIRVQQTEQLADDILLARDRKKFLLTQIEIAQNSIKDDRLRRDTIRDLRNERAKLTAEIEGLITEQREAAAIKAQQARDAVTERFGKLLQLAELRGNKDAILAALNRAIADSRRRVVAARKAKKGVLDEQIALETLLKQRRELLGMVEDESKRGPTAFDLLQQFSGIFGETAGNLIGGAQPFQTAGGINGFTADIAGFLRRTGAGGKALGGAAATKEGVKLKDEPLVGALGAATGAVTGLTNAILGRSNDTRGRTSTATRAGTDSGAIARNDNRWREASRARSAVDNRRGGI